MLAFSRAAVREIRRRLRALASELAARPPGGSQVIAADTNLSKVTVLTAHAFARRFIKKQEVLKGKAAHALLAKTINRARRDCQTGVLWPDASSDARQQRARQLGELAEPSKLKFVLRMIAVACASKKTLSETASMAQFAGFAQYVKVLRSIPERFSVIKKQRKVIDYGDMLVQAVAAIEDGASVPFSHILVDEYQDCSAAQIHLLLALANLKGRSIMVFGDAHQAIYGFAGSSYTPLSSVLAGVQELSLPRSRRLTAPTAALASAVAQHQPEDAIQASREGKLPVLIHDDTLASQTQHIVQHIQQLIAAGTAPEQIIVVARMKALLAPVEQLLLSHQVLTRRIGMSRHRRHALRVLRLVRMVEQHKKAKRAITPDVLRAALSRLTDVSDSLWKRESLALNKVSRVPSLEGRYQLCAKAYLRLLGGIRAKPELRADVNRWGPSCRAYSDAKAMCAAIRAIDKKAVVTGTIHAAKGGEWDHVLIVGATDGLLPLYLSRDDDQSLSEECNLLYVAITRARETVRLYHAPANHARSRQPFESVCRFLDDAAVRSTLRLA